MFDESQVFEMRFPKSRLVTTKEFLTRSHHCCVIRLKEIAPAELSHLQTVLSKRVGTKYDLGATVRTLTRLLLT